MSQKQFHRKWKYVREFDFDNVRLFLYTLMSVRLCPAMSNSARTRSNESAQGTCSKKIVENLNLFQGRSD